MEKNTTKPAKKKLELKKTVIAKFVMNNEQLKMLFGAGNTQNFQSGEVKDEGCTSHGIE